MLALDRVLNKIGRKSETREALEVYSKDEINLRTNARAPMGGLSLANVEYISFDAPFFTCVGNTAVWSGYVKISPQNTTRDNLLVIRGGSYGGSSGFSLRVDEVDKHFLLGYSGTAGAYSRYDSDNNIVPIDEWFHLYVQFDPDGTDQLLRVNGNTISLTQTGSTAGTYQETGNLMIFAGNPASDTISVAQFAIWNKTLTADEVADLAATGRGPNQTGIDNPAVSARFNGGAYFPGLAGQYIELTSDIVLTPPFYVEFRQAGPQMVLGKLSNADIRYVASSGTIQFRTDAGALGSVSLPSDYAEGDLIRVELDASNTLTLKVNGNTVDTDTVTSGTITIFNIGRGRFATVESEGTIWDVNINGVAAYDGDGHALADWSDTVGSNDATIITGLIEEFIGQGGYAGAVLHLPLDEGIGYQFKDNSGNKNDALGTTGVEHLIPKTTGSLRGFNLDANGTSPYIASSTQDTLPDNAIILGAVVRGNDATIAAGAVDVQRSDGSNHNTIASNATQIEVNNAHYMAADDDAQILDDKRIRILDNSDAGMDDIDVEVFYTVLPT